MKGSFTVGALASVLGALASFASIPLLLSHFGSISFGFLAQFFVFIAILPILEFGLIQSTIQTLSASNRGERYVRLSLGSSLKLALFLLGTLSVMVVISLFFGVFHEGGASNSDSMRQSQSFICWASLTLFLRMLIPIMSVDDYVNGNVGRVATISLGSTIVRTILLAAVSVGFDLSLDQYLILFSVASLIELFGFLFFRYIDFRQKVTGAITIQLALSDQLILGAIKIWILVLSWNGLLQYERLVLSAFLPSADFGRIWSISSLAAAVMLVSAPLSSFALPRLNRLPAVDLEDEFLKIARTFSIVIFCPTAVGLIYQNEIFELWLGAPLNSTENIIFSFYLIGNLIHIIAGFSYFLRYRSGISRRFLSLGFLFTLLQCCVIYFAASIYSAMGTSATWLGFSFLSLMIFALPKVSSLFGSSRALLRILVGEFLIFSSLLFVIKSISKIFFDQSLMLVFSGALFGCLFIFLTIRGKHNEYIW